MDSEPCQLFQRAFHENRKKATGDQPTEQFYRTLLYILQPQKFDYQIGVVHQKDELILLA